MQSTYGSLWLRMALYGSNCKIWLNTAPSSLYGPKTSQYCHYGSSWPIDVYVATYCSLWLQMALYGSNCYSWLNMTRNGSYGSMLSSTWLQLAHMAPKLLNMAWCGSLWLIGFLQSSVAPYGCRWLHIAQIATVGSIRLQMALMAPKLPNMVLYGS